MNNIKILNQNVFVDNIYWGKLNGPTYVYLEITRKCNCKCDFCQVNDAYEKDIDMDLLCKISDELKDLNCFELRLGGGEPLLNSNLSNILELLKPFSIWICTNGILLNENMCKMLLNKGVVGVRVSLDSLDQSIHNNIRKNPNAYQMAVENMKIAKELGLQVCLSMTVGKHNIDEIDKMKVYAESNGYTFLTHFIMPIGKGKVFLEQNAIANWQKINILQDYQGEKNCVAGNQSFAIDIDGNVSACTFLQSVGNMRNTSLINILNSESFKKYKKRIPNAKCDDCIFNKSRENDCCMANEICKGGCWALYEETN